MFMFGSVKFYENSGEKTFQKEGQKKIFLTLILLGVN